MELSTLSRYSIAGDFVFGNGERLPLVWDANYFSRANLRAFDARLSERVTAETGAYLERTQPLQDEFKALADELDSLARGVEEAPDDEKEQARISADARRGEITARLTELEEKTGDLIEEYEQLVDEAQRTLYAEELAGRVLMGWGGTNEGRPVPITVEVLKARPLLFLKDVFQFCREESRPKAQRGTMTRTPPAYSSVTSNGSSSPTYPRPSVPRS